MGAFYGNIGVLLRAWAYLRLLGKNGLPRVSFYATLAANYLRKRLQEEGFDVAYPNRMASHEFIVSAKKSRMKRVFPPWILPSAFWIKAATRPRSIFHNWFLSVC